MDSQTKAPFPIPIFGQRPRNIGKSRRMTRLSLPLIAFCTLLASSTIASAQDEEHGTELPSNFCTTRLDADETARVEKEFLERIASERGNWSVVFADYSAEGGYVTDQQIHDQIAEVNRNFQGTGLQFSLRDVDRFQSAYWFDNVDPATSQPQYDMKDRLRYKDAGPAALNIYSVGLNNIRDRGTLGYSSFPADYNKRDPVYDGILIRYSTLPGGSTSGGNLGRILTHEIGHWVGLYHTFENFQTYQNGCYGPGDYVDDTPAEASPANGCPIGRDTCNGGGVDPINNFMDYTNDACRTRFSAGQIQRMQSQVSYYRGLGV